MPDNPNAALVAELRRVADILEMSPDWPALCVPVRILVPNSAGDEAQRRALVDSVNYALGIDDPVMSAGRGVYQPTDVPAFSTYAFTSAELVPALGGAA